MKLAIALVATVLVASPLTRSHDLFTRAFGLAKAKGGETKEAREAARAFLHRKVRDPALLRMIAQRGCERANMLSRGHSAADSRSFFGAQAVAISAVEEIADLQTEKARRELVASLDLCLCQHYPDVVKQAVIAHGPALLPFLEARRDQYFPPTRPGELQRCSSSGVDFYIELLKRPAEKKDARAASD